MLEDPVELVKEAKVICEKYLKDKKINNDLPEDIKTFMAYLLATVKTIYQVDWDKALDFLDQFCLKYATLLALCLVDKNVSSSQIENNALSFVKKAMLN